MTIQKTIPEGYMTVGQVARKMGVTVRALQYYDKIGLLSPSEESEGGRRLYADKDLIILHQILSFKSLGFSLEEIKKFLISLDSPEDVAKALSNQAHLLREKIQALSESLGEIEKLKEEVLQMQTVDFRKYADIIVNLQMKNEYYWLVKHFDEQTLAHVRKRFDRESASVFIDRFNRLSDEIALLQREGAAPESEKGQSAAKRFWQMILDFTGGDMEFLPKLLDLEQVADKGSWGEKQALVTSYIEPALDVYLQALGENPGKGDGK